MTELSRRAFAAGAAAAVVPLTACTAPLYETRVTVVNTSEEPVRVYVAVFVKTLVDADSGEWRFELAPGGSRELVFSTGQEQETEVVVDPSTGGAERATAHGGEVRATVSQYGVNLETT